NISYGFSLNSIIQKNEVNNLQSHSFKGFFLSNTGDNAVVIPAAELEYNYLKSLIKGQFFKNKEATAAEFKQSFTRTDVLHISSHSFISEKDAEPVLELYKSKFYLFELSAQFNVP